MWLCASECGTSGGQRKARDPSSWSHRWLSCPTQVLRTELRSSGRTVFAFNCGATSPALSIHFLSSSRNICFTLQLVLTLVTCSIIPSKKRDTVWGKIRNSSSAVLRRPAVLSVCDSNGHSILIQHSFSQQNKLARMLSCNLDPGI